MTLSPEPLYLFCPFIEVIPYLALNSPKRCVKTVSFGIHKTYIIRRESVCQVFSGEISKGEIQDTRAAGGSVR